jgi:hypothetical protein
MPLTRNLYREDEVVAALVFCVIRGRHVEAAFWTLELLDSGMAEELCAVLERAWKWGIGIRSIGWLSQFRAAAGDSIEADLMIRLAVGLAMAPKDRSIPTLLGADLSVQPDRVNAGEATGDPLEIFVSLAVKQGKTLAAWGGLHGLPDPDAFLNRMAVSKHGIAGRKALLVLEDRAAAVAALCLSRDEFLASWNYSLPELPREVSVAEWRLLEGRRRRVFAVPPDCLYYFTERGKTSVYETNEKEIMGRLERPGVLWGSVYWDEVADWAAVRGDDDAREDFYDGHFPDDRPDEWSAADRAKSHGRGCLQRGAEASEARAFQGLLGRLPTAVWGELGAGAATPSPAGWNLKPVLRRKLVLT